MTDDPMNNCTSSDNSENEAKISPEQADELEAEDVWEDIAHSKTSVGPITPPETPPRGSVTFRKRKPGRAIFVVAAPRKQFVVPLTPPPPRLPKSPLISADLANTFKEGAKFTMRYAKDVVHQAVRLLRMPLSVLLFLWMLAFIVGRISQTLRTAFSPLCLVPIISSSAMCSYRVSSFPVGHAPQWADYPKLVDVQSATFEQLLDQSVGGSGLALEIKKAEMATMDLVTLVRVSDLTSRELLANKLVEFVGDAKKTGRGLQKLSSKVGGAVDEIMAVNDFALHSIESAMSKAPSPYSFKALLIPWYSPTHKVVLKTFTEAMRVMSSSMQRLILEAEASLTNLDRLEERLSVLHELVTREDSSISSAKSELLSELWTKVGGNKRELREYDKHLFLLKNLGGYRQKALVHVAAALQTLQAMSEDMEDLRERVAAPELTIGHIPVEVHMKSIRSGLERLKEGSINAKKREDEAMRRVLSIPPA